MRQIKFRAWDADMEMMIFPKKHYAPLYHDGHLAEFYNPEENEFHVAYDEDERFTLMQFTGLLDKNGKEIYEGDIAKVIDTEGTTLQEIKYSLIAENGDHYGSVIGGFVVECYPNLEEKGVTIEVIGNIYENPELLNP